MSGYDIYTWICGGTVGRWVYINNIYYKYIYVCVYICMCMCVYVYVYIYMYIGVLSS